MVADRQSDAMRACIENCLNCYSVCAQTSAHCLIQGGRHAEASHLRLLHDCAEICRTSADFMLRGSELHAVTCGGCAVICGRCGRSCRSMADDEQMVRCAEVCERCEKTCREMAGGASPQPGGRMAN
jgi:hypothetical protein